LIHELLFNVKSAVFQTIINKKSEEGVGLWCLTPFSTILPIYREGQALIGGEPEYLEKTTDKLEKTTDLP
jgi:hypothetical protein